MLSISGRRSAMGRLFPILSFVISFTIMASDAKGEFVEDILGRMNAQGKLIFGYSTQEFKEAGQGTFYRMNGYQARVLRSFCSDIYGARFTGEIPPFIRSGGSGVRRGKVSKSSPFVRSKLNDRLEDLSRPCANSVFVEGLLKEYWNVTGNQLEAFRMRLAKLINIYNGTHEHLIYGDPDTPTNTMNIETAVQAHSNLETFLLAVHQDTVQMINRVFSDPNKIFARVRAQLQMSSLYREAFPDNDSLEIATAIFAAELERVDVLAKEESGKKDDSNGHE